MYDVINYLSGMHALSPFPLHPMSLTGLYECTYDHGSFTCACVVDIAVGGNRNVNMITVIILSIPE